jgi:hypothetical protein
MCQEDGWEDSGGERLSLNLMDAKGPMDTE